jgi:uncharacterized protein YbaP (TraB family)
MGISFAILINHRAEAMRNRPLHFFTLFIAIFFTASVDFCHAQHSKLWIANRGEQRVYIYPTAHAREKYLFELDKKLIAAIKASDIFVTEYATKSDLIPPIFPNRYYDPVARKDQGTWDWSNSAALFFSDIVSKGLMTQKELNELRRNHIINMLGKPLEKYQDEFSRRYLDQKLGPSMHSGYDELLFIEALQQGKRFVNLEVPHAAFWEWSQNCENEENNSSLLVDHYTIGTDPNYIRKNIEGYRMVANGDLVGATEVTKEIFEKFPGIRLFHDCACIPRNRNWVNRIDEIFAKTNAKTLFMPVGSAHVYRIYEPDRSLLAELASRGFSITEP